MEQMQVRSLGQEDPLEEEIVTYFSYFCLENSMDRGVWQATVHGVAKSWTQATEHIAQCNRIESSEVNPYIYD